MRVCVWGSSWALECGCAPRRAATQSFSLVLPCFSSFPLECVMCVGTQWEDLQNCGERLYTVFAGAVKSLFTRLWPQRPLGCAHGLLCSVEAFHTHPGQQTGKAEASTLGRVSENFLCFFFFLFTYPPSLPHLLFTTNPFSSLSFKYHCLANRTLFFFSLS